MTNSKLNILLGVARSYSNKTLKTRVELAFIYCGCTHDSNEDKREVFNTLLQETTND